MTSFAVEQVRIAQAVDGFLARALDRQLAAGAPARLIAASRHAVLGGGKRYRPFLVAASAALFGVSTDAALSAAAAIECIHGYSLVHDDLPSMDNDVVRRGQPTVWKAYDEWTAILVGDGLQSLAFELLADPEFNIDPDARSELVLTLARAAGNIGMVGGQALDLAAGKLTPTVPASPPDIARLQSLKTGKLIEAACAMGGILGRADAGQRGMLQIYAENLGAAFQISDDLLDAEGCPTAAGKATGKDADQGKATFVGVLGADAARALLDEKIATAAAAIETFGTRAAPLAEAAAHLGSRKA